MGDVSIIGLGAMGSALARALLSSGRQVTVWNRTSAKAEALVQSGAVRAPDAASAIEASPVILVCVDNYEVTRSILNPRDVRAGLSGRVLVQLSTGTPQEARETERWGREAGAEYLDGAILAYPDKIGTPDAAILIAGADATFRRCESLLRSLAGGLTFVGEQVGAASALDCASLAFIISGLLGVIHGARICEVEGLPVDGFGSMMAELAPVVAGEIKRLSERIEANRFGDSQAALKTYAAAAVRLVQQARDGRINDDLPTFVSGTLAKGVNAGFGDEDLAALIKMFRNGR